MSTDHTEELAWAFSSFLKDAATPEELLALPIILQRTSFAYDLHKAMREAFQDILGRLPNPFEDSDALLMQKTWELSVANRFWVDQARPEKREPSPDRPELVWDGMGINGPDKYRSRLFTKTPGDPVATKYGPMLAAAPALFKACQNFVAKVEAGKARSRASYAEMKAALALAQTKLTD